MLDGVFLNYFKMGFPERAREICHEMWISKPNTYQNTFLYLHRIAEIEKRYGNRDSTLRMFYEIHEKYPWYFGHLFYGAQFYNNNREYTKALGIMQNLEKKALLVPDSTTPIFYHNGNTGYTYLKNGMKEKADYHFNLAIIYSILNDKQKTFYYLEMINQSQSASFHFIDELKTNPMFDNVRQEPEFQKIARELEKKYLKEHEKIKKLLISKRLEPV
jgi:tetratricopeptide (TPR) repeat protein